MYKLYLAIPFVKTFPKLALSFIHCYTLRKGGEVFRFDMTKSNPCFNILLSIASSHVRACVTISCRSYRSLNLLQMFSFFKYGNLIFCHIVHHSVIFPNEPPIRDVNEK